MLKRSMCMCACIMCVHVCIYVWIVGTDVCPSMDVYMCIQYDRQSVTLHHHSSLHRSPPPPLGVPQIRHEVDFDQLQIENSQLNERFEEKNRELLQLKLDAGNTMQVLNSYKVQGAWHCSGSVALQL